MKLDGKVAIVTGGGRGIGAAVAVALAAEGAAVALAARSGGEIEAVAERIRAGGGTALALPCDVADPERVAALFAGVDEALGPVDVLVNAAGVAGPIGRAWEVDLEEWVATLRINLVGTLACCRAAIPRMIGAGGGVIVNFSGGGATFAFPRFSAYAASKVAVVRLTETLAAEVAEHPIRVNAIAPGLVVTRMQDDVLAAGDAAGPYREMVERTARTGEGAVGPELAAELVVFLASDASVGISGKLISAPHDGWREWGEREIAALRDSDWLTLRRLDEHTIEKLDGE